MGAVAMCDSGKPALAKLCILGSASFISSFACGIARKYLDSAMANANYIRVKLKFGNAVKVAKLDARLDTKLHSMGNLRKLIFKTLDARLDTNLHSMGNLRKLIFKTFPEVGELVQSSLETTGAAAVLLDVKWQDSAGDYFTLESDGDLQLALEARSEDSDLQFEIRVIQSRRSKSATSQRPSFGTYENDYGISTKSSQPIASQVCRASEHGHCEDDPTCRFSHEIFDRTSNQGRCSCQSKLPLVEFQETTDSLPFKEVDDWLMNELTLVADENIEQFLGEKGIHMLSKVVEQRCIPAETITLLVKLLAKEQIRTSLLRQQTNKVYGVLLGSPFLQQLHAHVSSRLGSRTAKLKPQDIRPYLLLIEELQSRTADGWKEVPLDGLERVVVRLEENGTAKDELRAIASRLVDHREKIKRLLASSPPDECSQDEGAFDPQPEFCSQKHGYTITKISEVEDFEQVQDGGCSLACEYQLECGHVCPRRCHPGSHNLVVCPKPCLTQYKKCVHVCNVRCHGAADCPPCKVIVPKKLLNCEHMQAVECSLEVTAEVLCCRSCPTVLQCGHKCRALCGRPCTKNCLETVVKVLPCGHSAKMPCHLSPKSFFCDKPCGAVVRECQHPCQGSCGECRRGAGHVPCRAKCWRSLPCGQHLCQGSCGECRRGAGHVHCRAKCGRSLPCGHLCEARCSISCPPCKERCQKRCFHSRCSKSCVSLCTPCRERCPWRCKHHQCDKLCHEICTRPRCDFPCPKLISECRHPCIGLCGEPCPTKCRLCHPQTLDAIKQMTLEECEESARFVQLQDCGHVFEVSGLDTWMDADETVQKPDGSAAIKLRECPECGTPIWRTHRYSNNVKKKYMQMEKVKKKINGYEKTRRGNIALQCGKPAVALSFFTKALHRNPGLMDAHFGAGCCGYGKAITHLSFIVERSSFAPALAKLIDRTDHPGGGHAVAYVEKFFGISLSRAEDGLAVQAIVQWASALIRTREFTDAIELCDAILAIVPDHSQAAVLKRQAQGEVQAVHE